MRRSYLDFLADTDTALTSMLTPYADLPDNTPAYGRQWFLSWSAADDAERNGAGQARRNLRTARRFVRGQIAAQARATYRQTN